MANPYPANFETPQGGGRLTGQINFTDSGNQPGGTPPNVQLRGPFTVLETDTSLSLWTPAVGDVIVDIWLVVVTTFQNPIASVEVYMEGVDFFNAGQSNALAASAATQDAARRWPLGDWSARTYNPTTPTVPSVVRAAMPVTADILHGGAAPGVAQIWALAS